MDSITQDKIVELSDGNPGAINVLCLAAQTQGALDTIEMCGLKGAALWIAFQDYAERDMDKMVQGLKEDDPELINALEKEGYTLTPRR